MCQGVCIEAFDEFCQLSAFAAIFGFTQADMALAQGFDGVKYMLPRMVQQHLAEDNSEQFDSGT